MNHVFVKHVRCLLNYCSICDGGLGMCDVCKAWEGGLPIECPGRRMSVDEQQAVYEGRSEYARGRWWVGLRAEHDAKREDRERAETHRRAASINVTIIDESAEVPRELWTKGVS